MVFSYNWLQSFFQKKLAKPEKLAEFLTMHSFEVEEVKKEEDDWIIDINVLPNRAGDCFSHLGIARECSVLADLKLRAENLKLIENKKLKAANFLTIDVRNKNDCPRYTARVITDVKVSFSPKWLRDRLRICGLRPINNIVDIANYVMLETGQPLHAFDFDKIESPNPKSQIKKIIIRRAKQNEKITTLDNEKYDLDEDILIIADPKDPLAIAGIKGGKKAEIDKNTKIIVIESANFNQKLIRQASRAIDLKTDASWRFEHGLDPNLTESAINQAAFLIQKLAGGQTPQGLIDFYPKKVLAKKIKLDLNYVDSLLGVKMPEKEIINILKKLGFKVKKHKDRKILEVEIPTQRLDISLAEDLIEEIGRIYGYQKIPSVFPTVSLIPPKRNLDIFWEDLTKDILKELGFTEVYNYSFISEKDADIFDKKDLIEIENPTSVEQKYLRPSLIPNLLKNIQKNQKYYDKIRIFELSKIFKNLKTQNPKVAERRMLNGLLTGEAFYQAKGVVDLLLNKLGISSIWYDDFKPKLEKSKLLMWQPGKCAEIKVDQEKIGFLGEISPRILESLKIKGKLVIFELDFEDLSKLSSEETIYQPVSRFPAAVRDLAVLVPRKVKVVEVLNKINIAGGSLIRDVDLFDIYEGEELPQGKKNLAFHIIYQAESRTLKSEEIDVIQEKIINILEKDPEWEVRK